MKEAVHAGLRFSLSLHRMRGAGWGEGFRASAQAAPPLLRLPAPPMRVYSRDSRANSSYT